MTLRAWRGCPRMRQPRSQEALSNGSASMGRDHGAQKPIGSDVIQSSVRAPGGDGGTGASPFCLEDGAAGVRGKHPQAFFLMASDAEPLADPGAWGAISPAHSRPPSLVVATSPSPCVRPATTVRRPCRCAPKWQWFDGPGRQRNGERATAGHIRGDIQGTSWFGHDSALGDKYEGDQAIGYRGAS